MATLEDIQNALTEIGTEVDKIGTETQSLLDKIGQLEAGNPDQQALIDSIAAQAQTIVDRAKAVDDLVPDADNGTGGDNGGDGGTGGEDGSAS